MSHRKSSQEAPRGGRVSALASWASALTIVFPYLMFVLVIPIIFILMRIADIRVSAPQLIGALKATHAGWPTLYNQYTAFWAAAMASEAERYLLFLAVTLFANMIFASVVLVLSLKNGISRLNSKDAVVLLAFLPGFVYELWFNLAKFRPAPGWDFYIDSVGLYFIRESILIHLVFMFVCMAIVAFLSLFAEAPGRKQDRSGI